MQGKHHDKGVEVFLIKGEIYLGKVLKPHLFSYQDNCVRGKTTREDNDNVKNIVSVDSNKIT
jgi:hypothetical protein